LKIVLKSVVIIVIIAVAMIGMMIPSVFAESVSNDVGSITIDESIIEISSNDDYSLKIYGMINPSQHDNKGHIQITLPDGTSNGVLFITTNDGYFESFFDINYKSQLGDYKILGTYGSQIIGSLNFSVSEKQFSIDEIREIRNETSKEDVIVEATALKAQQEATALKAQQESESIINTPTPSTSLSPNTDTDIDDIPAISGLIGLILFLVMVGFGITILSKLGLLKLLALPLLFLLGGRGGIKWFSPYSFDGKRRAFNNATKAAVLIRQGYTCNICGGSPQN